MKRYVTTSEKFVSEMEEKGITVEPSMTAGALLAALNELDSTKELTFNLTDNTFLSLVNSEINADDNDGVVFPILGVSIFKRDASQNIIDTLTFSIEGEYNEEAGTVTYPAVINQINEDFLAGTDFDLGESYVSCNGADYMYDEDFTFDIEGILDTAQEHEGNYYYLVSGSVISEEEVN